VFESILTKAKDEREIVHSIRSTAILFLKTRTATLLRPALQIYVRSGNDKTSIYERCVASGTSIQINSDVGGQTTHNHSGARSKDQAYMLIGNVGEGFCMHDFRMFLAIK